MLHTTRFGSSCDRVSCVLHEISCGLVQRINCRDACLLLDQRLEHGPEVEIGNFCRSANGEREQHRFSDVLWLQHPVWIIAPAGDFVKVDLSLSCCGAGKDRRHPHAGLIDLIP